ncbi:hypothetical protein HHI36_001043 [Cryptolaemus montrouzieri]|uniref:28S ribosomal protein S18a, mitochondrial n=1 Tax=Cryptolaemus montrouzieri TaxID=559131 RepID=A0ABD2P722_9CUCU
MPGVIRMCASGVNPKFHIILQNALEVGVIHGFGSFKVNVLSDGIRTFSVTANLRIKEIITIEDGNHIRITANISESDRKPYLVKNENDRACPLCASGLHVKHTDVLILSQFVRSDGCMLPRRITGLCSKQQRIVSSLVTMAQKSGLMPNLNPANSNRDPQKRYKWEKFNKYFDESTIKWK